MSFEQIRILESLLLPPSGFITLGLIGALFIFTRVGKQLLFASILMLYLLSTPFISSWLNHRLEQQFPAVEPSSLQGPTSPQALVVLGGGYYGESVEYGETAIGPFYAERIRYAAWLAKQTGLPIIVSSGKSDAPAAAKILKEEYGVEQILVENGSWTTNDHARNLKKFIDTTGIQKVGVITHGWHMPRAIWTFHSQNIQVQAIPMGLLTKKSKADALNNWLPSMNSLVRSRNVMHEFFGLLWYRIDAFRNKSDQN